ncbi:MAG TPA: peptidoglycan DD-metalloendopeptidase family protein [Longimicrobiaceae bacterium]|nr:peptidoglycan DD-metalloendopeptidase family protein [Longimicrobiaceae bacterium]
MPISRPYRVLAAGLLGSCGLALASVFVTSASKADEAAAPPALLPALHAAPLETAYRDTLRKGETLSDLLERARLDAADAHALIEQLRAQQDLRSLRPGAVIAYRRSAATGELRKLEMSLDPDHKVSIRNDGGTMAATVAEVPVRTDTAVLAGEVRTSLYQGLLDGSGSVPRNERERIADVLADRIFAWQVDFSRDLRAGDRYRIMYERDVRPDGTARSGRILAVQFDVAGEDHEAYFFRSPDGTEDYYDARGGSLKRAFLRAPLEFRRISSVFSTGRYHPILHRIRAHKGIDYAAAQGTPVRAVGDGVVARAGHGGGYGNVVEIRHARGYSSRYGHLRGFAPGIHPGTRVRQGQLIGFVGMTGLATGPHLHYEFHTDGVAVNPSSIKYLTGEPLTGGRRDRFRELVAGRVALMDRASNGFRLADAKTSAPRSDAE